MTHRFDDTTVAAILRHMNDDHRDDNLLIVSAFGPSGPYRGARMTGLDGAGGDWTAETDAGDEVAVRVDWPGGAITERPEVRREIVALYDEACRRLGVAPRPH
ncbi:DUF2470 domain-containing protein [Microbacterium sp. ET2]|uniref:DUF2470 domain-containing protein n=1 Tax=Microbacterium albipurpureum TaxID=3050384 RepID=UPI00259CC1F4|nr:DUF2470 domain-containing protein [Microbacterium sp. ET2 (Ac-2212)]WJL94315.1 DUF2470 domain-containing protein [Microbacterium sp. ET2 (Ac-2212)]